MIYLIGSSGDTHWHECNATSPQGAKILCSKTYTISLCGSLKVATKIDDDITIVAVKYGYDKWQNTPGEKAMTNLKAQAKLIKLAVKVGSLKLACELALRANVENNNQAYLENAYDMMKDYITPSQWAGYLAALMLDGKYKRIDGDFGQMINKN